MPVGQTPEEPSLTESPLNYLAMLSNHCHDSESGTPSMVPRQAEHSKVQMEDSPPPLVLLNSIPPPKAGHRS